MISIMTSAVLSACLFISTWPSIQADMIAYDSSSISGGSGTGRDPLLNNTVGDVWWKESGEKGYRTVLGKDQQDKVWTIQVCPLGSFVNRLAGRADDRLVGLQWSCTDGSSSPYFGYGSETQGIQGNDGDPLRNYCQPLYGNNKDNAKGCRGATFDNAIQDGIAVGGIDTMQVQSGKVIDSLHYKAIGDGAWLDAGSHTSDLHDNIHMSGMLVSGFAIQKSHAPVVQQISIIFRPATGNRIASVVAKTQFSEASINQDCAGAWAETIGGICSPYSNSNACGPGAGYLPHVFNIALPPSGSGTSCPTDNTVFACDLPCPSSPPSPPPSSPSSTPPPSPPSSPSSSPSSSASSPSALPSSPFSSPPSPPPASSSSPYTIMSVSEDCTLDGHWTNTGSCIVPSGSTTTCDCGTTNSGLQTQTQGIKSQSVNGGKGCDSSDLTRIVPCKLPECPLAHRVKRRVIRF